LAISQIKYFEKFGILDNKIPCHAYEIHTKNPLGIFGWGRGLLGL
jgi:unsaturated rhamnogalacturonyl hydrolase